MTLMTCCFACSNILISNRQQVELAITGISLLIVLLVLGVCDFISVFLIIVFLLVATEKSASSAPTLIFVVALNSSE